MKPAWRTLSKAVFGHSCGTRSGATAIDAIAIATQTPAWRIAAGSGHLARRAKSKGRGFMNRLSRDGVWGAAIGIIAILVGVAIYQWQKCDAYRTASGQGRARIESDQKRRELLASKILPLQKRGEEIEALSRALGAYRIEVSSDVLVQKHIEMLGSALEFAEKPNTTVAEDVGLWHEALKSSGFQLDAPLPKLMSLIDGNQTWPTKTVLGNPRHALELIQELEKWRSTSAERQQAFLSLQKKTLGISPYKAVGADLEEDLEQLRAALANDVGNLKREIEVIDDRTRLADAELGGVPQPRWCPE